MKGFARIGKPGPGISPLVSDQAWLLAILAGASFLLAMVVVFIVSFFTDIKMSGWNIVGSIAPWYMAVMSGWIAYIQIPIFVAHGRTRRMGFREWLNTGLVLVPLGAILIGAGFLLETGVYNLAGFRTDFDEYHHLGGTADLLVIMYQYFLTFAAWYALGAFAGACLYRFKDWGWLSIPVAIGVASVTGVWNHTGGGFFAFLRHVLPGLNAQSHWLDFALTVVAASFGIWLAWKCVQNMPLRNP